MMRRNKVPETVSHETRQAKALQRMHELEELRRRTAEPPSMSAVTALDKAVRAEENERLRQATGAWGFGAVPKRQWDQLSWEERDRMVATARAARESAAAAAIAGTPMVVEAPGLVLSKGLRAAFGSGTPERFSKMLNERLLDTYRGLRRTPPGVFGDHYVVNSPSWIARKLMDLGGDLTVGNLVKHKVFGVNSTPWEHMTALERALWKEKGQLPLSSIYFYRGKIAAPTGRFRGATHWADLTVGTPVGTDELNVTVGSRTASPALLDRMTFGTRTGSSSFTLVENPAAEGPIVVRPKVGDDFGRPLAGGQIGGTGEPWVHQDAKGGDTRVASKGGDGGQSEDVLPEPGGASVSSPAGGGPRIVINPTTFRNRKDALCVAFNEGFRLWMEANDFQPRSEPTDAQRKFFSDTAYADDELQLRRTILARIATFDTSVKDPTDDQLAETADFLGAVLESGWCKNEWERDSVSRLAQAAQAAVGAEPVEARQEPLEAREVEPLQARAAMGGGETDDEEEDKAADPREAKGYVGATDEAYDPALDMNSDQYDSDKATSYMADKLTEEPGGQADPRPAGEEPPGLAGEPGPGMQGVVNQEPGSQAVSVANMLTDDGRNVDQIVADAKKRSDRIGEQADEYARRTTRLTGEPVDADRNGDGSAIDHKEDETEAVAQAERDEVNAEYEKLRQSGALDDLASFDNSRQTASQGQPQEPGVSAGPGSESGGSGRDATPVGPAETEPGTSKQGASRRGGIENDIVSKDSPGSLSYRGPRRGGIENPIVDPTSQGSIEFSGARDGGIESPIVDPSSPGPLSYRRRRRRKR